MRRAIPEATRHLVPHLREAANFGDPADARTKGRPDPSSNPS